MRSSSSEVFSAASSFIGRVRRRVRLAVRFVLFPERARASAIPEPATGHRVPLYKKDFSPVSSRTCVLANSVSGRPRCVELASRPGGPLSIKVRRQSLCELRASHPTPGDEGLKKGFRAVDTTMRDIAIGALRL